MPRDMLGDAATLGDGTDTGKARVIMRNGKYPAVPAQSPVFADYAVGDVEQADVGHHARFLAVDVYPLVFVEVGADILFRKVAHIRERQPREGRKKHQSKEDRFRERQTQSVVNKRFFYCLPLQPNSRERQDNARLPLPSHYLFRYLPEAPSADLAASVPFAPFCPVSNSVGRQCITNIATKKVMAMKTEMKVLLYIKRSGQDKDGLSPLMGRIAVRGKNNSIAQFSCKFKVDVRLWNATAQRCTGKSRMAVMANREIERTLLLLRQRFNELKDIKEVVSAEEVKNAYQGLAESQDTIMKLFAEHNEEYALRVGVNRSATSYYHYTNTYRHLATFLKDKYHLSDMPVKQLDENFIEDFDMYMRTVKRFMPKTILGHVNRLKSVMMLAVFRGIIPFSPFKGYRPQKPEFKQMYLTEEELGKFANMTYDTPNRNFTRDMFLFSCWTGICYCDMRALTEKNLVKAEDGSLWIHTERQKTGTPECVRLMEIPLAILEKYKGMDADGKLLPMLTKESMNRHLKKMSVMCGINRPISFHQARHTFGSIICLSQGIPIETVSKIMGHKHIKTTQRYAKVTQDKIDRDVDRLNEAIGGKFSLFGIDASPSTIRKDNTRRRVNPSWKQRAIVKQMMEG